MSAVFLFNFLRKATALIFFVFALSGLIYFIVGCRSIIINQSPAAGYKGFQGASAGYNVQGLSISRESDHQSDFYSKDSLVKVSEKTDYHIIQVKARSSFNYLALFAQTIQVGIILLIIWNFRQLFRQENFQHPFTRKVVRKLKKLAILFIALDVVRLIQYFTYSIFLEKLNMYPVIQADLVFGSVGNITTGLIVWVIAVIFQRGIDLQEESELTV
jgi:hypothetical protein